MIINVRHDAGSEEVAVGLALWAESKAFRDITNPYLERGERVPDEAAERERKQARALVAAASKTTCREAAGMNLARYGYVLKGWPDLDSDDSDELLDMARARVLTLWGEDGP